MYNVSICEKYQCSGNIEPTITSSEKRTITREMIYMQYYVLLSQDIPRVDDNDIYFPGRKKFVTVDAALERSWAG